MNILVALFFLNNVAATAVLGSKFFFQKDKILKYFGIALLLDCIAFAVWSTAVMIKPQNLNDYVTVGSAFFIAALLFLLYVGTQNLKSATRWKLLLVSSLLAVALFYLRTFVYTSNPSFSPEGLFFFNVHPISQMLYIFGLVITAIPALYTVASKFKSFYAGLIRLCFTIEIIGGIILLTTTDTQALYLTGWVMGVAYFVLWTPLIFGKKAFSTK